MFDLNGLKKYIKQISINNKQLDHFNHKNHYLSYITIDVLPLYI